ncbi:MAG: GNAT family N-acetyltransferase [Ferruginibacter sp.]
MELKNRTIYFRPVESADAPFIKGLRVDTKYNQYLSQTEDDIVKQEKWIQEYKQREQSGTEYYYVIHRNSDSLPVGTVRIYDFLGDRDSFCWGSWILTENKTRYAALESALLIFDFAFFELGFKRCHMNIRKENLKVIEFHKKIGVKFIGETDEDYLGHYFPDDYKLIRRDLENVIASNEKQNL